MAKTFALAIDEAAKLHPAAEMLIVHAALLAPEPIPLFLFAEAREKFGEKLAALLADDGLDEAVAALRAFALVDRETIEDERDPAISTDTIRLHRLVREVAASRCDGEAREEMRRALVEALAAIYPRGVFNDPKTWPRARRLDALALTLVGGDAALPDGAAMPASYLLDRLGSYRQGALGAYASARPLFERALAIGEKALGPDHPDTATSLNNLAVLLQDAGRSRRGAAALRARAGDLREGARPRPSRYRDEPQQPRRSASGQGDLAAARPFRARAGDPREGARPRPSRYRDEPQQPRQLLQAQGDLAAARPLFERALAIREKALGPDHPDTATSLNNLAELLQAQGDLAAARPLFERALAIREKALGPDHPDTATSLNNLAFLLQAQGDLAAARPLYQRALLICEKALGPDHPNTVMVRGNLAGLDG